VIPSIAAPEETNGTSLGQKSFKIPLNERPLFPLETDDGPLHDFSKKISNIRFVKVLVPREVSFLSSLGELKGVFKSLYRRIPRKLIFWLLQSERSKERFKEQIAFLRGVNENSGGVRFTSFP
jgi:hypothetical protein